MGSNRKFLIRVIITYYYYTIIFVNEFYVINNRRYMIAVAQFPDMRHIPFSTIDTPTMHMVGTTVKGVMYFNTFPMKPVKIHYTHCNHKTQVDFMYFTNNNYYLVTRSRDSDIKAVISFLL